METSRKRILLFIESQGIKPSDFLLKTGLNKGFVDKSHINSGASDVFLSKILEAYPDLCAKWLLTGEGPMLNSDRASTHISQSADGIPLIPIEAMGGFGTGESQIMDYHAHHYIVPEFSELNVDFMIRVKGSSMYPKYSSGDIVACRKLELDTFFQWNKVYVLDTSQGPVIKRIHKSTEAGHITCVSENKEYPPFDLNVEADVYAIALVVGVIRFE